MISYFFFYDCNAPADQFRVILEGIKYILMVT